ncbi:hypothetical protein BD324DRAFT_682153 [Kockovaella imperatae]|uniref:S1-like domain-containing protein n=1 Tax=Kockovaella imperatae TaxID=4999 RepID=A0A1Y1UDB1_9TREE|nr:hypothetical protein BD324DRAFT_682153 [Kockovaella imperatae]ORX36013.1 hypothetical protein BD324DRAFT_682153 [Kockovaella imperatae]
MGRPKAPVNDLSPSTLPPDHKLVMIGIPRGSGNFECVDPEGEERLVEVGTKLKKMVLITRGDFGFIRIFPPSPEPSKSSKGKSRLVGEIVSMISAKEVKAWKKSGEWPEGFGELNPTSEEQLDVQEGEDDGYESDNND